jgi:ABC-type glycerol-3-phosphate transport system substrate-binding protein
MSRSRWTLVLLAVVTVTAACAAQVTTSPELVFITIDATPPDAYVYLDGRPLGSVREVASRAFHVTRGPHTVVIVAEGFRPYRQDLLVQDSTPQFVRTVLLPR